MCRGAPLRPRPFQAQLASLPSTPCAGSICSGSWVPMWGIKWFWGARESWPAWIRYHFDHPRWEGFAAWDLIMPLFLFVVGVAMPFSIGRRIDEGAGRASIYLKMIRRVALLWILGMISQGNLLD